MANPTQFEFCDSNPRFIALTGKYQIFLTKPVFEKSYKFTA